MAGKGSDGDNRSMNLRKRWLDRKLLVKGRKKWLADQGVREEKIRGRPSYEVY